MRLPLLLVNYNEVIAEGNTRMDPTSTSTDTFIVAAPLTLSRDPLTLSREQLECRKSPVSGMMSDEAQQVVQRHLGGRQLHARRRQQMMNSCAALVDMLDSNVETYENRMSSTISEASSSGYWSSRTSTATISQLSMSDNATDTEEETASLPMQSTYEIDRLPYDIDYWTTESVKCLTSSEREEKDFLSTPTLPLHGGVSCNVRKVTEAVSENRESSSQPFPCCLSVTPTHGKSYTSGDTKFRHKQNNLRWRSQSLPSSSQWAPNLSDREVQSITSFLSSNSSSASLDSDTTIGSPCELSGSLVSVQSASNGD